MVLKYAKKQRKVERKRGFRPLTGIWFWNWYDIELLQFVLHVSVPLRGYGFEIALSVYQRRSCSKSVSVPLRGYGFEILTKKRSFGGTTEIVSVPLRGYGFEISIKEAFAVAAQSFPSPYGDMVLKFRMSWYQLWWILYCFRPLTGIWFWNGR